MNIIIYYYFFFELLERRNKGVHQARLLLQQAGWDRTRWLAGRQATGIIRRRRLLPPSFSKTYTHTHTLTQCDALCSDVYGM